MNNASVKTMMRLPRPDDDHDPAEEALKAEVELLLFLLVMLWSNSDIERTQTLRVYVPRRSGCHGGDSIGPNQHG